MLKSLGLAKIRLWIFLGMIITFAGKPVWALTLREIDALSLEPNQITQTVAALTNALNTALGPRIRSAALAKLELCLASLDSQIDPILTDPDRILRLDPSASLALATGPMGQMNLKSLSNLYQFLLLEERRAKSPRESVILAYQQRLSSLFTYLAVQSLQVDERWQYYLQALDHLTKVKQQLEASTSFDSKRRLAELYFNYGALELMIIRDFPGTKDSIHPLKYLDQAMGLINDSDLDFSAEMRLRTFKLRDACHRFIKPNLSPICIARTPSPVPSSAWPPSSTGDTFAWETLQIPVPAEWKTIVHAASSPRIIEPKSPLQFPMITDSPEAEEWANSVLNF